MVRSKLSKYFSYAWYKQNRFVVYSQIVQLFEIVEYIPTQENDTDIVYSFTCKDNTVDCTISIITRKQQENRKQLYIPMTTTSFIQYI
jgi:hypothetical protein